MIDDIKLINPKSARYIENMGDVSIYDWIWFFSGIIICLPIILSNIPVPTIGDSQFAFLWRALYSSPIFCFSAALAFLQSKSQGKFRWRVWRWIKFSFKKKSFNPIELDALECIKEVKQNHLHFKSQGNEGVLSIYRIEGFDASLLSDAQIENIVDNLTGFFSANIRFKLVSARITYTIPVKKFPIDEENINHYGINFAKNRYLSRIAEINSDEDLKQQGYFLIIQGPSINKNEETYRILYSPISDAHLQIRPALSVEIDQVMKTVWLGAFDINDLKTKKVKNLTYDKNIIRIANKNGTFQYGSFLTFNSLPESATLGWLSRIFNSTNFSLIADFAPMSPTESSRYMEKLDGISESIMTTKWFKKRASDAERLKISHIKDLAAGVTVALANGDVQMKDACFYVLFQFSTRKELRRAINEYVKQIGSFSTGWTTFDCRFLQRDAFIATRLHDIPTLQKTKTSIFSKKTRIDTSGDYIKNTYIWQTIDHKLLTTSLGASYPFFTRASIATENTWFKGFEIDESTGDYNPFFNDYWKKNEMYNSFNRFYQGRNGSGKSYTADIDIVSDRLDNKFIISIDPKPERDIMTKNLGGQNLLIGANDKDASYINIFDVLIVPAEEGSVNKSKQNPLLAQYQANLTSIAILLSLDVNKPDDKIILSCFNDVQIYVYEKIKKISIVSDFEKISKKAFPLMKDFYDEAVKRYNSETVPETKSAFNKLIVLMKEHAVGISAPLFNNYSNIDWTTNRMWNLIVRDIALNYGNKNILAVWTINIIRVASTFLYANKKVSLYIDELHLIHDIDGVLARLDEFARVDRSFGGALNLINQNFNSIRAGNDPKKTQYYESIFTMSQYNFFFTTGEEDVLFLVQMLEGSGNPLSLSERNFITRAGRGKSLLVMTAYDRYRIQFDISFWKEIWEVDLEPIYKEQVEEQKYNVDEALRKQIKAKTIDVSTLKNLNSNLSQEQVSEQVQKSIKK